MIRFANPWVLMLLMAIPVLLVWLVRKERPATMTFSDLALFDGLPLSPRLRWRWVPMAVRLLVLILLIIALARPQSGRQQEIVRGRGVDIVLAVDISGSMAALDFEPENRLGATRGVFDDFVAERRYDRIGLVVFASQAFTQSPPTFDYDVLRQLLGSVDIAPEMGLEDGTAIGMGVAQAASMLQESDAKSRVIVLLTDGVNNAGKIDPQTAAQAAAALDIKIYAIGMGKPGMVPFPVEGLFGRRTQMVESELDEETLRQIAETTGGLYFNATDTDGLVRIMEQINQMEKSEVEVQVYTRYQELVGLVLFPALFLLLLEFILRQTLFRTLP